MNAWRAAGASVIGAAHVQRQLPNEDAIGWRAVGGAGGPGLALAIADGHGSASSFRSAIGAAFAVETALDVVAATDSETIGSNVLSGWRERVAGHLAENPFTADEWAALDAATDPQRGRQRVDRNPLIAYGSTLVVVAAVGGRLLLVQLGDGDIVLVGSEGQTDRPLPPDDRLIANETTSLATCDPGDFRVVAVPEDEAELVLLATDGYSNSFATDADFEQVAPEIHGYARDNGLDWVAERLATWLEQATREGSGDDISVGLLWRSAAG